MGLLADAAAAHRLRAEWAKVPWPDWRGQPVVVVGSGPSARNCDLEAIRGRARVIVVNGSFRLAPWADVLYARDQRWWEAHRDDVATFEGLRVSAEIATAFNLRELNIRPVWDMPSEHTDVIREIYADNPHPYTTLMADAIGNRHVRGWNTSSAPTPSEGFSATPGRKRRTWR